MMTIPYTNYKHSLKDSSLSDITSRLSRARSCEPVEYALESSSQCSSTNRGSSIVRGRESIPRNSYSTEALIRSSQRLRARSMSPSPNVEPYPVPSSTKNMDFYRGKTKSIYEKEPLFEDFVRNIPSSETNLYDNSNLSQLKRRFHSQLLHEQIGKTSAIADPYEPSGIDMKYLWRMTNHKESRTEMISKKHRTPVSGPTRLPTIYVYHRNL